MNTNHLCLLNVAVLLTFGNDQCFLLGATFSENT